ncbi:hypothetical protein ABK046_52880, partial [Streptomyces caeruleatus]
YKKTKGKICQSCIIKNAKTHHKIPINKRIKYEKIKCIGCDQLLQTSPKKIKTKMCRDCYKKSTTKITYDEKTLLQQV